VTDFGLARCQRDAGFSKTGDIVGTMRYMSPEQASGKSALIDHRTDIYSLGATLYELLTLKPAAQGEDGQELLRCIIDESPLTPRKLHPQTPLALQNVVLKAMAKTRDDRYDTAKEFAEDLHRFLDGKPTVAKPPTVAERMTKWCIRHKEIVATAVCVALLASIGFALSTVLIARERANTQRNFERAEENFRDAQEAVDRFGAQYAERLASVPGAAGVRREMLTDTLAYYQRFVQQAGDDRSLQADLAITHSKMGKLSDEVGSTDEAIASYEKALVIFKELSAGEPKVVDHQRRLALCQNNLAMALRRAGRIDDAKRTYHEAMLLQQRLAREALDDRLIGDLAVTQTNLGLLLSETGRKEEAERSFREAIRLQEQLVSSSPNDAEQQQNLAASFNNLSTIYIDSQPDEAIACYESALRHQQIAAEAQPASASCKSHLAATYNNLGSLQVQRNEFVAAAGSYKQAIQFQRELLKPDPSHKLYRQDLAVSYNNYGLVLSHLRRTVDAKRAFQQSLAIQETLVALNPDDIALRSSFGSVYNNLGIAFEEQGNFDKAATTYEDAVRQQRMAFLRAPSVTRYRVFLSKHYFNLGRVLRRLGQADRAAQIALARRELWSNDGERLYSVAKELALASRESREWPANGELTAEQTALLAIDTLEQAAKAGFHLPSDLSENEAFAPLKDNDRFLKLVGS
jgi:tetratricopeptide (TPR) repeat protein